MPPRLSLLYQLSQHGNDLRGKVARPMQQQASHGPLQCARASSNSGPCTSSRRHNRRKVHCKAEFSANLLCQNFDRCPIQSSVATQKRRKPLLVTHVSTDGKCSRTDASYADCLASRAAICPQKPSRADARSVTASYTSMCMVWIRRLLVRHST